MRPRLAIAVILLLAVTMAMEPAEAATSVDLITIPFITTDSAVFTQPSGFSSLNILEFNSNTGIARSAENISINFPLFSDGIVAGPVKGALALPAAGTDLGAGSSSNILPFGLVNLAFPSIDQTANDSTAYQRTYFFSDTLAS